MKLMLATGISAIFFFGPVDKKESVDLMNDLYENGYPMEIIQLTENLV